MHSWWFRWKRFNVFLSFTGATRSTHQATILGHVSDITASSTHTGLHLNTAKIFFFSNKNVILKTRRMHLRSKKCKIKLVFGKKVHVSYPTGKLFGKLSVQILHNSTFNSRWQTAYEWFTVDLWRILWLNFNSSV